MSGAIDKKLEELGIELPVPAAPIANYVGFVRSGRLLFVSGQICLADGALVATGKLGSEVTVEQGQTAARACAVNLLAQVKSALAWLTARPIAHRGLHDPAEGIIENTPSAAAAAVAGQYGIEADLQISADGEAMVYHDDTLGRLTDGSGALRDISAAALTRVP